MALIRCPECQRSISDKALTCPHCGYPMKPSDAVRQESGSGMPLVHIVYGPGLRGGLKPAKGFIAIGNVAIGIIAIGGFAVGVIPIAGIGVGLISFGGMAFGLLGAAGGMAVGYIAVGGFAIGVYAIGGLTFGTHTIYNSPELREFIRSLLGMS